MFQKKNRKKFIVGLCCIVLLIVVVCMLFYFFFQKDTLGLVKSGNYLDMSSNFRMDSETDVSGTENMSSLQKSYLESVFFEIQSIDKNTMTANITVQVPEISNLLLDIVDEILLENPDSSYEELLLIVKSKFENELKSDSISKQEYNLQLPVEKNLENEYKLVPTEELDVLIKENLKKMYSEYLKMLVEGMTDEENK